MTVNRAQNSVPTQRMTDITDGTSNTLQSSGKAAKPFSKDVFETSAAGANACSNGDHFAYVVAQGGNELFESTKPAANSLCSNEVITGGAVSASKDQLSGLVKDDRGVEKPPAQKSFMDYTVD
jgi:hypothetical protein